LDRVILGVLGHEPLELFDAAVGVGAARAHAVAARRMMRICRSSIAPGVETVFASGCELRASAGRICKDMDTGAAWSTPDVRASQHNLSIAGIADSSVAIAYPYELGNRRQLCAPGLAIHAARA
jgi:hypothetical protein